MWASFTRNEKQMLVVFLVMLGGGAIVQPFLDSSRRTDVFTAGQPSAAAKEGITSATRSMAPAELMPGVLADGKIDLNTASQEGLVVLPGIGPSRAQAIIALRTRRGGFRTVEELDDVPGIGPATMTKLRDLVAVSPAAGGTPARTDVRPVAHGAPTTPIARGAFAPSSAMAAVPQAPAPVASGSPAQTHNPSPRATSDEDTGPVNINRATVDQLATLKYIGPALAERIVAHRARHGAFRRPEDLQAVKGIGPRVIQANPGRIVVY